MIKQEPPPGVVISGCGWVLGDRAGSAKELTVAAEVIRQIMSSNATFVQVSDSFIAEHEELTAEMRGDKACWMSAVAIEHALKAAGLSKNQLVPERTGLVIGSELAGQLGMINFACEVRQQTPRFVSPLNFPQTVGNFVAGALARALDIKGPNQTIASGATSGLDAIIEGCELIKVGCADVILAGVTEVKTDMLARAFPGAVAASVEGALWCVLERASDKHS